jgi:hypothetical protein
MLSLAITTAKRGWEDGKYTVKVTLYPADGRDAPIKDLGVALRSCFKSQGVPGTLSLELQGLMPQRLTDLVDSPSSTWHVRG